SDESSPDGGSSVAEDPVGRQPRCRFLQLGKDNTVSSNLFEVNRPKVFLATLYLQDRLTFMVQGNDELHKVRLSKHGPVFRNIAADINKNEPMLQGVSPQALFGMFESVIEMHNELDQELENLTGSDWNQSEFSKAVEAISSINKDINNARDSKKTDQEKKEQEEKERSDRVMRTLLQGRGSRTSTKQQAKAVSPPREKMPTILDALELEAADRETSPVPSSSPTPQPATVPTPQDSTQSRPDGPPCHSTSQVTAPVAAAPPATSERNRGNSARIQILEEKLHQLLGRIDSFHVIVKNVESMIPKVSETNDSSKIMCYQLEARIMDRIQKIEKKQEDIFRTLQEGLGRQEQGQHQLASKLHHVEVSLLDLSYSINYGNGVGNGGGDRGLSSGRHLVGNQPASGYSPLAHRIP
ncbi:hypothetical protein BGZ82_003410, partial [Podila clonocystis]